MSCQMNTINDEASTKSRLRPKSKIPFLPGIPGIIPIIVAGGMTLAAAVLIAQAFHLQEVYAEPNSWLWLIRQLGGTLLGTLMVPILSAYMAYSIADKPGLGSRFSRLVLRRT